MVVVASALSINNALASNDSWSTGAFYSQQSVDDRDFKLANLIINVPINNFFTIDKKFLKNEYFYKTILRHSLNVLVAQKMHPEQTTLLLNMK